MEPSLRRAYNRAFGPDTYRNYLQRLESRLGPIPFRVAETPLFLPKALREDLERSAREIVAQISRPALIEQMKQAIPAELSVPGMDPLPNCTQVDFAIVRGPDGELTGRVVELQAFPSLYALMVVQSDVMQEILRGLSPELDRNFSIYFSGHNRETFLDKLRRTVVAGEDPEHVVLLDLDPRSQKTYPDFVATKQLLGVDSVCPTSLIKEGRTLYRRIGDRRVPVRRIYNRVVFDELIHKQTNLPFKYTDDLDVTWCSHPNWYWVWSKYTLPFVDHPAVPRARTLASYEALPEDLSRYVLKPLFSFAGAGVNINVTPADIAAISDKDREGWILQEKIAYEPALPMPTGEGVKAEVRMMFLRAPGESAPELVLNLVRLSRGAMLGVDQNKDLTWVGGSVGLWSE